MAGRSRLAVGTEVGYRRGEARPRSNRLASLSAFPISTSMTSATSQPTLALETAAGVKETMYRIGHSSPQAALRTSRRRGAETAASPTGSAAHQEKARPLAPAAYEAVWRSCSTGMRRPK